MRNRKGSIKYHPIGVIHSPFKSSKGTPIQPIVAQDSATIIEVFIKPFIAEFDNRDVVRTGWLESKVKNISEIKDDGRFCKSSE